MVNVRIGHFNCGSSLWTCLVSVQFTKFGQTHDVFACVIVLSHLQGMWNVVGLKGTVDSKSMVLHRYDLHAG